MAATMKRINKGISLLQWAGVKTPLEKFPAAILQSQDSLTAYQFWCKTMGFRDETKTRLAGGASAVAKNSDQTPIRKKAQA